MRVLAELDAGADFDGLSRVQKAIDPRLGEAWRHFLEVERELSVILDAHDLEAQALALQRPSPGSVGPLQRSARWLSIAAGRVTLCLRTRASVDACRPAAADLQASQAAFEHQLAGGAEERVFWLKLFAASARTFHTAVERLLQGPRRLRDAEIQRLVVLHDGLRGDARNLAFAADD
jgi:hypothetical protein